MVIEIKRQICDGHTLKWLIAAGLAWLQHNQSRVDQLNVFPVPDGDTGKNMRFTLQKAYEAIADLDESHVGIVSDRIAKGALRGARGNSGVILSQLLRGFADALNGQEVFDARLMAAACRRAVDAAYKAVIEPTEGTILTVAREAAEVLENAARHQTDLVDLLDTLLASARKSLAQTPNLLPVLKKAGVVDSGGQGLVYILEGMSRTLHNEPVFLDEADHSRVEDLQSALDPEDELGYGYDVQFLMQGDQLNVDQVRAAIDAMGWSTLVVGDANVIKVHVHVHDPGQPLSYAISLGAQIDDVVVENMQLQYEQYLAARLADQSRQVEGIAVIAVASGQGMTTLLYSDVLNATRVVSGGQTMNPSAEDFLVAIQSLTTDQVVLLPNNRNVLLAAEQAARMAEGKDVRVVPSRSVPQGISALLATVDMREDDLDTVIEAMEDAIHHVITIEITTAIRDAQIDELAITEGEYIGLVNDNLVMHGTDLLTVLRETLRKAGGDERELVTLYYGEGLTLEDVQPILAHLKMEFPQVGFEVVDGGQPLYPYIVSVE
ncbi:MAG: DAK2 domain-containing protein [Anaerolineae bacterium]